MRAAVKLAGRTVVLAGILGLAAASGVRAEGPALLDHLRDLRELREAALSPDARQVAATITASTAEGGQSHIWLLGTDGKTLRQVTLSGSEAESGERAPAWSNDGAFLYFRAKRGKVDHLYRLPLGGGEAQALMIARPATGALQSGWGQRPAEAVEVQTQRYEASADGKWIAVIAGDGVTAARDAQITKKDDGVRVGRDDLHKARLYLVEAATGLAREVPLPDDAQTARWNAISTELVAVTAPDDEDLGPAARTWRVPLSGAPIELAGLPRTIHAPDWTPGGLVYFAQCKDDAPPGCVDLYAYDFASAASRDLTQGQHFSMAETVAVEADGKSVVTPVLAGFRQRLARIRLADGALSWIDLPPSAVLGLGTNARQTGWAVLASSATEPRTVYFTPKLGAPLVKLATPALLPAEWPRTPSQPVSWTQGGQAVEGLLYLPKIAAGTRVPLVVNVHGGPAGLFQDRYSPMVNLLVAQGWAVLQTNPRGSLGYGAAFEAANKNDLGGEDFKDIMTGVDTVLAKYPLDPDRMALIGYSYGGEMAGFVVGKTDRFKAIVSGAPVIDQFSEYGTEDGSWYDRWYYGKPWEHFADAWRQSPLAYVGHAKTPFLLLQGEDDPTDPQGQSQEMRRALRQMGAPVVLATYPRETHATLGAAFSAGVTREPWHGLHLQKLMLGFIADAFAGKPQGTP